MLCSEVETLYGGFHDWLCDYRSYWYFRAYSFLDFEHNFWPKWPPNFPHDGLTPLEHQYFPIDHRFSVSTSIKINILASEVIVDIWEACSLKKIRRAAGKFQCVPYFCMLLVWGNGEFQHQRPFEIVYWIALVTYPKLRLPSSVMSRV